MALILPLHLVIIYQSSLLITSRQIVYLAECES